jgi:hypothetical protein
MLSHIVQGPDDSLRVIPQGIRHRDETPDMVAITKQHSRLPIRFGLIYPFMNKGRDTMLFLKQAQIANRHQTAIDRTFQSLPAAGT